MNVICVDDEDLVLQYTMKLCRELDQFDEVTGYTRSEEALTYAASHSATLAILDIDMPDMSGLALAAKLKSLQPDVKIIFLTGYSQYAVEAFALHVSGYLLKPANREQFQAEIEYALSGSQGKTEPHIRIQTFGDFDIFVDGDAVGFSRSKAKELLAYLVDKRGSGVSRAEAFAALWEDVPYDRPMQKQLDVYIRSLRDTLREYGVEEMLEMKKGIFRVIPDTFTCDAYLFYAGDRDAVNAFRGEYMSSYSWASITESILYWKMMNKNQICKVYIC